MARKNSNYQIGLGAAMLRRSRIVFLILTTIMLTTSGSAVYAGFQSGEIQQKIVQPTKKFFSAIADSWKESTQSSIPSYTVNTLIYNATSSATVKTSVTTNKNGNNSQPVKTNTTPQQVQYTYDNTDYEQAIKKQNEAAQKAWEDALKKQEEWSKQKQQENQQWFNQATQQDAQAAKASYDAAVQKMQQDTEAWKKAHGF